MKKEDIELIDTYNSEGYLIKRTANGVPMFIPQQDVLSVQIITPDTEWIMQKKFLTVEEFKNNYEKS